MHIFDLGTKQRFNDHTSDFVKIVLTSTEWHLQSAKDHGSLAYWQGFSV